jgi:hypothetical protein
MLTRTRTADVPPRKKRAVNKLAERSFVEAFVSPPRRSRYLSILETDRGRDKLRRHLAHFPDLDPRFARPVKSGSSEAIAALLRQRGAPSSCYVLSEDDAIDAQELGLEAALEAILGRGWGTILSCLPGKLAYYEGEDPGERYLLERR